MFKSTYSKEEVQTLISNSIQIVKNELVQLIQSLEKKNILLEETIDQIKLEQKNTLNMLNNKFISSRYEINDIADKINTISNKVDLNLTTQEFENTTNKLNNKIEICSNNLVIVETDLVDKLDYNIANLKRDIGNKISNLEELINNKK